MIKVVIVDDSRTARLALRKALETDADILVVGEASNGDECMRVIQRYDPDIVTMDVYLDGENGLDLAGQIMTESPRPIVAITGINPSDPKLVYKAMDRGVLEVFAKLPAPDNGRYNEERISLVRVIKTLASVPVIHLSAKKLPLKRIPPRPTTDSPPPYARSSPDLDVHPSVLVIGASTGGPPIISVLLSALKHPLPVPAFIVQHISNGFGQGFANWLGQCAGCKTELVTKSILPEPGTIYIAPDDQNMVFSSRKRVVVAEPSGNRSIVPSIDLMFESCAEHHGGSTVAVILTGMGADGSKGLKLLRDAGAYTIAQSLDSCAVDSMPSSAIDLGAARLVLSPAEIAREINRRMRF